MTAYTIAYISRGNMKSITNGTGRTPVSGWMLGTGGNLYYNGAKPFKDESGSSAADAFDPGIEIIEKEGAIYLKLSFDERLKEMETEIITSETFGEFVMIRDRFENPDGTSVELNADYFGNKRNPDNPAVGPFESAEPGENLIKIWPKE